MKRVTANLNNDTLVGADFLVRPVRPDDLLVLARGVGTVVDELYPAGGSKLVGRLEASVAGYANSYVVCWRRVPSLPLALAAEQPKDAKSAKLATFWVDDRYRRQGLGTLLLENRISKWLHAGYENVHVTVRKDRAKSLSKLFCRYGFRDIYTDRNRYGDGQDEVVLLWHPSWLSEAGFAVDAVLKQTARTVK